MKKENDMSYNVRLSHHSFKGFGGGTMILQQSEYKVQLQIHILILFFVIEHAKQQW
jgi:hypothetical protein